MRPNPSATVSRATAGVWWAPIALGICALGIVFLAVTMVVWAGHSPGWGYDFRAYFDAAARLLATGTPYQAETLAGPFRPGPAGLYLYSPVPALLLVPMTSLGFDGATVTWLLMRIALLVLTCALLPVPRTVRLALLGTAALSAPVLYDLNLGNVSLLVTFFAVVCWRWLDRPLGAVAIAASLTIRPTMALIPAWWLIRRQWRAVAWTGAAALVIMVASLPFVGLEGWREYLTVLAHVGDVTGVFRNVDLASAALAAGIPEPLPEVFLLAGYVLAIGAILFSLRRDREIGFAVTLMATLLLSPLLWDHYLTNLIVPGALLAARGRRWGVLLPLLGWLPLLLLPLVATAGMLLPFAAHDRGPAALQVGGNEPEPIADADAGVSGTAGA